MTEFTLGARPSCSDGFCGEVIRTILDPATRVVTHLVIEPKHRQMDGRLVPLDLVDATGGEIGRVEGFVNPADNKVTHVLLQEGHMWGRKEVAIPVSAVASVDAGIRLNITKQQVEDLPPLNQGHP
jgi:hypothetical protein